MRETLLRKTLAQDMAVLTSGNGNCQRARTHFAHHARDVDALAARIPKKACRPIEGPHRQRRQIDPFIQRWIERHGHNHAVITRGEDAHAASYTRT